MKKAYIIGAGPSGLIAAHELLKKGIEVEIFELSDHIGGMCRTWKEDSYLLDTGPHIYHTPDKQLEEYWKELFGDLLVEGEFWSKNTVNGKIDTLIPYPLSHEAIEQFDDTIKEKIKKEIAERNQESSKGALNFDEYVENLVGRTLTDMFFKKYPEKVWGKKTTELTADWAPKRIEIREKITPFYTGQYAAVGKYGTGCIYERLAELVVGLGGKINTKSGVLGLQSRGTKITGLRFFDNSEILVDNADIVISTMPITILGKMLGVESDLLFRGIASVYIGVKSENVNWPKEVDWLYFDHDEYYFNRITNSSKLSPEICAQGSTLITIESTYTKGDMLDSLDKEEFENEILDQVISSGLLQSKEIEFISSNKEDFVYPIQNRDFQIELASIQSKIGLRDNLYSIGTGGDFNYADSQVLFYKAFDLVDELVAKDKADRKVVKTSRMKFKEEFHLGEVSVGQNHPPVIIGEIGLNHNGNIELAKRLIDEAAKCGLKFVKLQKYLSGNSRVSDKVKSANYIEKITDQEETLTQMFDKYSFTRQDELTVFDYARSKGLNIFSTPFDIESAFDLEKNFEVDCYKIASVDLINLPLLSVVASFNKPVILSCGMARIGDIEDALEVFAECGNDRVILLHCNSSYPAPIEGMNINVIKTLRRNFRMPVGLSDHSLGLLASTVAMSIGAQVIERHFTLDRYMEGPDHILSSEPEEMAELVRNSENIYLALGDGIKRVESTEYANAQNQRKCLYLSRDMNKGEIITSDDLAVKGPGGGILPKMLNIVVGRKVIVNVKKDYPLTWEMI